MLQSHWRGATGHLLQNSSKYRAQQGAKGEVEKINDSGRRTAKLGTIRFLDHGVREHGRTRSYSGSEAYDIGGKHIGAAIECPGEACQKNECPSDNHWLSTAQPIGEQPQQGTTDDPSERHG